MEEIMLKKLYFLTIAVLIFASCNREVVVWVNFDYAAFIHERDLWLASKPPNYRFHFEELGAPIHWAADTIITVRNNEFYEQEPQASSGEDGESIFIFTIDDIYESVVKVYLQTHGKTFPTDYPYLKKVIVEYDLINHIPIEITYVSNSSLPEIFPKDDIFIQWVRMFEKLDE
jgi:hypothetical protein